MRPFSPPDNTFTDFFGFVKSFYFKDQALAVYFGNFGFGSNFVSET